MNFNEKLLHLKDLYGLEYHFNEVKDKNYLELNSLSILDRGCLTHINHVLSSENYIFDTVEAFNNKIVITYFKK